MGTKKNILKKIAKKYIWWKTPDEALEFPQRIVAQVMNMGTFEDVQKISTLLSKRELRNVINRAEAGQFNARSWHYWHHRLGLAKGLKVPRMPGRGNK